MNYEFDIDGTFTLEDLKILVVVLNEHKDESIKVLSIGKRPSSGNSIRILYEKIVEVDK
jgi:hypothetical protein